MTGPFIFGTSIAATVGKGIIQPEFSTVYIILAGFGIFDLNYKSVAKNKRNYYLLNWSNDVAKSSANFYFESKKQTNEDLESKLEFGVLKPYLNANYIKNSSVSPKWFDNLSHSEIRNVLIEMIKTAVICHKKRLELDFKLVGKQTIFTRRYSRYKPEDITSIARYLLKSASSIFDAIIRIMTDPIVYGMEESLPEEYFGYLYKHVWEALEKEGMLRSPIA